MNNKKFKMIVMIVFILICAIIFIGILVPYSVHFVSPIICPDENIAGVDIWNQYIGIVLGIIAIIFSIIFLIMCFGNLYQSHDTETRTSNLLEDNKTQLGKVSPQQLNTSYLLLKKDAINEQEVDERNVVWETHTIKLNNNDGENKNI